MKERSEEIACVVVPAAICEWLKCRDEKKDGRLEMVND